MTGYDQKLPQASLTDVGVRRSHNQDSHAVMLAKDAEQWRVRGHVFLVADGMGAHAVGELASKLAADIITHTYQKCAGQGSAPALRKSFIEANATIHARGQQNREFQGMGTTATALLLRPEGAWIGHVGDSRAYRIRDAFIEQLSFDHSLVWELARRQNTNPDDMTGIPSNVLVRSLGPEPLVQVDVEGPHDVQDGDIFVLCSDGLSGQVTDHEIGAAASVLSPAEACRFLVDLANLRGGPDNITVVVVHAGAGGDEEDAARSAKRIKWNLVSLVRGIPWPILTLMMGTALAVVATALKYFGWPGDLPAFLLAAGAIGAGLVGLFQHHGEEKKRLEEEKHLHPPRTYRRTPCHIDGLLVDKLAKAVQSLRQQANEKNWEIDDTALQKHVQSARLFVQEENLADAFRDYCRAMRVLSETIGRYRNKEEVFAPVWEK